MEGESSGDTTLQLLTSSSERHTLPAVEPRRGSRQTQTARAPESEDKGAQGEARALDFHRTAPSYQGAQAPRPARGKHEC